MLNSVQCSGRVPDMTADRLLARLRRAIRESGLSQAEIARRTNVSPALICKFLAGETDMGAVTLDNLAHVLGLRLVPEPKSRVKRRS